MNVFGYELDIDSIELWFLEPKTEQKLGLGELSDEPPVYNSKSKVLRFSLEFDDPSGPYQYEYIIQEVDGQYRYREIQSQKDGYEAEEGTLELLEGETKVIFLDQGNEEYRYYFHIDKDV